MPASITDIEQKILDYMVQYLRANTYQPSIREIGERFGIKSTKTVSEHLQALADKGFLERDPSRSRGVRILGVDLSAETVSVPCYDRLPNERGGLRTERAETFLSMDRRLAGARGAYFVRTHGNELAALGVNEGDYVLVEPADMNSVEDGAVIVVRLGDSSDYYRFEANGSGVFLRSLDGSGGPTLIEEPANLGVLGKVSALYRHMDRVPTPVSSIAH